MKNKNLRNSLLIAIALMLSACTTIKEKKVFITKTKYVVPNIPAELTQRIELPERRVWSNQDMQGEDVGGYIISLNKSIDNANFRFIKIREFLDNLKAD